MIVPDDALAGVRVLELGSLIAGPFCGRLLADFGADVVKVEPPNGGDPLRTWSLVTEHGSLWSMVQSRNKRSVCLDLRPSFQFRGYEDDVAQPLSDEFTLTIRGRRYELHGGGAIPPMRLRVHGEVQCIVVLVSSSAMVSSLWWWCMGVSSTTRRLSELKRVAALGKPKVVSPPWDSVGLGRPEFEW